MATVVKEEQFKKEKSLNVVEMEKVVKGEKADEEGKEEKAMEEVRAKLEGFKAEEVKVVAEGEKAKAKEEVKENIKMDVEPKTGVSFPVNMGDGKRLNSVGCRKKKILALGFNIYAFGIYADNVMLKEFLKTKFWEIPEKPTTELYEAAIDSDVLMTVRLIIVFRGLSMSIVRKNFDDGLGASIKKLTGGQKNEELVNKVMAAADDSIKLPYGSVIEITRLPGYVLQTKVKDELISKVESELLCRAYFHMYLGDDPYDKEAKERFGNSMELPQTLPCHIGKKRHGMRVVTLQDPSMRLWPVLYHESFKFVGFLSGWKDFVAANNLQQGNLCELIEVAGARETTFQVMISKVSDQS